MAHVHSLLGWPCSNSTSGLRGLLCASPVLSVTVPVTSQDCSVLPPPSLPQRHFSSIPFLRPSSPLRQIRFGFVLICIGPLLTAVHICLQLDQDHRQQGPRLKLSLICPDPLLAAPTLNNCACLLAGGKIIGSRDLARCCL